MKRIKWQNIRILQWWVWTEFSLQIWGVLWKFLANFWVNFKSCYIMPEWQHLSTSSSDMLELTYEWWHSVCEPMMTPLCSARIWGVLGSLSSKMLSTNQNAANFIFKILEVTGIFGLWDPKIRDQRIELYHICQKPQKYGQMGQGDLYHTYIPLAEWYGRY